MRITDLYFSRWLRPGKTRTLAAGGLSRTYVVHVPEGHDPKAPMPVVLALHGRTMNGPMMAWFSGLNRKADEARLHRRLSERHRQFFIIHLERWRTAAARLWRIKLTTWLSSMPCWTT